MRFYIPAIVVLALGACVQAPVPDSGSGVGFDSYSSYDQRQAAREAQLQGRSLPARGAISDETSGAATAQTATAQQMPPPPQTQVAQQTPSTPTARVNGNNVRISDEQNFDAVSSRESIESDRERLERQRAQYVVIEPTAVPTGDGGRSATVVEFALATSNRVGEALYRRSKVFAQSRFNRNCQKYPSPDLAQEAFLKSGGPKRDSKGLDPDGDGFACSWDPQPFRNAKAGG